MGGLSSTLLLTTKFHVPPVRTNSTRREALTKSLNVGIHSKLTLISAPVGYGKSTLISEWVEELQKRTSGDDGKQCRVAWLALDEDDDERARFPTYLLTAIQRVVCDQPAMGMFGNATMELLGLPQLPSTEQLLTPLINQIAELEGTIVIVLDDYHHIETESIHSALEFLLRHTPPNLHIAIAS